jgi:hypothetical protein
MWRTRPKVRSATASPNRSAPYWNLCSSSASTRRERMILMHWRNQSASRDGRKLPRRERSRPAPLARCSVGGSVLNSWTIRVCVSVICWDYSTGWMKARGRGGALRAAECSGKWGWGNCFGSGKERLEPSAPVRRGAPARARPNRFSRSTPDRRSAWLADVRRQQKSYWVGREASRELARNQCFIVPKWRKRFLPPDMPPDIYLGRHSGEL